MEPLKDGKKNTMNIFHLPPPIIGLFLLTPLVHGAYLPSPSSASQTTQGVLWYGSTHSKNHTLKISIEAGYLDVVEDVEIGPAAASWNWPSEPTGDKNTMEVTGRFYLPIGSAITGLLIWNGDQILKGKLKPAESANEQYEDFVDRNTTPPVRPRDPFFVSQVFSGYSGYDGYQFKVYPVDWKGYRKIRLRYLIPRDINESGSGMALPNPVFIAYALEESYRYQLESHSGYTQVHLKSGKSETKFDLPASFSHPYEYGASETLLFPKPEIPTYWLQTTLTEGDWQGHYLHYRAPFPKKALEEAGLIRETVFLWKWNHPETFFERKSDDLMATSWGQVAKVQANQILQTANTVWGNAGEVGLVLHVGDRHRPNILGMGALESEQAKRIQEVLHSIGTDNYWSEIEEQIKRPNDPELNRPTEAQNGVVGFHLAIKAAYSLFSPNQNRLRTILLVTVGPSYSGDAPIDEALDMDFLQKVSLSPMPAPGNALQWPGVDLSGLLAKGKYRIHSTHPGTGLPVFGIQSIRMRFTAGGEDFFRVFDFPWEGLGSALPNLQFAGHAKFNWVPEMRLEVQANGRDLPSITQSYLPIESPNDTNLVKLWSRSPFRVSDKFPEGDLGAIFGVVDMSNSLLALEGDTASPASKAEILAGGVPHLQPGEIFAPPKSVQRPDGLTPIRAREVLEKTKLVLRGGWIEFHLPNFSRARIKLVSPSGRLWADENLTPGLGKYRIAIPASARNDMLILLLEMDGSIRKFLINGLRYQ